MKSTPNVPIPTDPKLVTVAQAAVELSCSPRSVWRLISQGALRSVRIGRAVRVPRESISQFIANGGQR